MSALRAEDAYPRYTYDDYVNWEDRWELINGIAYSMAPAPTIKHQKISNNIAWELNNIFKDCSICTASIFVDWKIDEDTVVQPDNLVFCHKPRNEMYLTKAPVIIFEILSKSTAKKDLTVKYELYEKEGVKYYCIANPDDEVVKVYKLKDGRYIKAGDFSDESFKFKIDKCDNLKEFNFSKIW